MKPTLKVEKSAKQLRQEQRQSILDTILEKKANGKLTLDEIDEKLNIIIEILSRRGDN